MSQHPPRSPQSLRLEFRASTRGALALALALSLVPAGVAVALGAGLAVAGGVLAGAVVAGLGVVRVLSAWATRNYDQPLAGLIEIANEIRQGNHGRRMPEGGSPAVRVLTRMLNEAWASVDERSRLSQANLLSVEMQFDRIHSVLLSLVEGVVVVDMLGEVLLANPAARTVLQGGGRPIEGRPIATLVDGELQQHLIASLAQMSEPSRSRAQVFGLHHGAKVLDVSVVRVRSDRPDHDFGSVVVLQDVTRNYEIARLKDEFLSNVSHELCTPLTNICAFSEILSQVGPGDEENWQEFVTIITDETRRLRRLVDDVLDFSSLEAGRITLQRERFDVVQLVKAAAEQLMPLAQKRGQVLDVAVPPEAVPAETDRERLHQVVLRVLDNAIKFTPEGGTVRLCAEAVADQVRITIDDSGRGIPVEQRESVFDKFHQIGNTLTDKPTGQGLSLAICRRVLTALGGMIWCEAGDLGGAAFHIVVPAQLPEEVAGDAGHKAVSTSTENARGAEEAVAQGPQPR